MKRLWIYCGCLAMLLAGLGALGAEKADKADKADKTERTARSEEASTDSRKLLEEVLMARLTRELALDESQTVLLMRHMVEFRDRMIAMRRERTEKMRELRQAVRESKDEEKIGALLNDVIALNQKSALARDEIIEFDGFELTTWQKARLLLFLTDFEGEMKRLLNRAQERRTAGQKGHADAVDTAPSGEAADTEKKTTENSATESGPSAPGG